MVHLDAEARRDAFGVALGFALGNTDFLDLFTLVEGFVRVVRLDELLAVCRATSLHS